MKGLEPTVVMSMVLVVLGGVLVGGVTKKISGTTVDKTDEIDEQLGQFHREITLGEIGNQKASTRVARRQLQATNYLVTLRSTHCNAVQNVIHNQVIKEGGGKASVNDQNKHLQYLSWAFLLEEDSVSNLECIGGDTFMEVTGIKEARKEMKQEVKDAACDVPGVAQACWADNKIDGAIDAVGNAPVVGSFFGGDGDPKCPMCKDPVNDQPGRYGNVEFNYPKAQDDGGENGENSQKKFPIVIDADREGHYAKPDAKIPVGNYITGEGVDDSLPGNWNAWSNDPVQDKSENQDFWLSTDYGHVEPIRFAPDPMIARYTRKGLHEGVDQFRDSAMFDLNYEFKYNYENAENPPNNCNEYPIKPFRPAMINVPLLTNKPLYYKVGSGTHLPLSKDVKSGAATCRGRRGAIPNPENFESIETYLHADYQFVICPGSEGRIQSNAGLPHHTDKATHLDDWEGVEKYSGIDNNPYGESAGENTVYPFIELTGSPEENARCLYERGYVVDSEGGNLEDGEWVQLSDESNVNGEDGSVEITIEPDSVLQGSGYIFFVGGNDNWYGTYYTPKGTDDSQYTGFGHFSRHYIGETNSNWGDREKWGEWGMQNDLRDENSPLFARSESTGQSFVPEGGYSSGELPGSITFEVDNGKFEGLKWDKEGLNKVDMKFTGLDIKQENIDTISLNRENLEEVGVSTFEFDTSDIRIFTNPRLNNKIEREDIDISGSSYQHNWLGIEQGVNGHRFERNSDTGEGSELENFIANNLVHEFSCSSYTNLMTNNGFYYKTESPARMIQYKCGLEEEPAYDKKYWKFKKYFRVVSKAEKPGSLWNMVHDIIEENEGIGYLNVPENLKLEGKNLEYEGVGGNEDLVSDLDNLDCENNVLRGGDYYQISKEGETLTLTCLEESEVQDSYQSELEGPLDEIVERINYANVGGPEISTLVSLPEGALVKSCGPSSTDFCLKSTDVEIGTENLEDDVRNLNINCKGKDYLWGHSGEGQSRFYIEKYERNTAQGEMLEVTVSCDG